MGIEFTPDASIEKKNGLNGVSPLISITLSPEAQEQIKNNAKAIEDLGARLGEIGIKAQEQAIEGVDKVLKKYRSKND